MNSKNSSGVVEPSSMDRTSAGLRAEPARRASAANRAWVTHLVRQYQAGVRPEECFEVLFREYEPACHRFFQRRGLVLEAEELAQKVMLRVYKGIGSFRLDASFDTWTTQIMTNVYRSALQARKTKKRKIETESLDALLEGSPEERPMIPEPRTSDESPLGDVLAAERKVHLEAALGELPNRMRQSLLFFCQGHKYREIADAQGVSMNTVKKQIIEGRKRLRRILGRSVELFGILSLLALILG